MAYIDIDYYRDYSGDTDSTDDELTLLAGRASDVIDQITQYRIPPFDDWNTPTQELIQKATAALVEYAVQNGGLDVFINGATTYGGNVRIGSFSYGDGRVTGNSGTGTADSRISKAVLDYLLPTGLLDATVRGCGCGSF